MFDCRLFVLAWVVITSQLQAARLDLDFEKTRECDLSRYDELKGRFQKIRYAGAGANGCVILASDSFNHGTEVAIKVSKKPGKLDSWEKECERSKLLHAKACHAGKVQLQLVERYLPICLEVGGTDAAPYMVMHSAAGKGVGEALKSLPSSARIPIFAQMVGALSAMHGIGFSHNDLTNQNVVLLDKPGFLIVFIDFGETEPLSRAQYKGGYKQDENLIARMAAQLAGCPGEAQYPNQAEVISVEKKDKRKEALFECLQKAWGTEEADFGTFLERLGDVIDEAYAHQLACPKGLDTTRVPALALTPFVQKHQPPLERLFPGADCASSDANGGVVRPVGTATTSAQPTGTRAAENENSTTGNEKTKGCEALCQLCPKTAPMYVCISGKARKGCSKHPWHTAKHCSSSCACSQ